jgi:hypothetical protein
MAGIYLVGKARYFMIAPLVLLVILQSYPLISNETERFKNWPTLVNAEFFQAPLTIFYGTPVHQVLTGIRVHSESPCIEIHGTSQNTVGYYRRFLQYLFPGYEPENQNSCDENWKIKIWKESVPNFTVYSSLHCEHDKVYSSFQEILFPLEQEGTRYLNTTCVSL